MANVVINGGQLNTNIRNVQLVITSPTRPFVYASETSAPLLAVIGSNWIDTASADPFTMNFVLSSSSGSKTVYVQFADDASGTSYSGAEQVSDSIELFANVLAPSITSPVDGAELTNRSITVEGTAEAGSTVTITVEAIG